MDDELSALSSPPLELIAQNKTWIIKEFGVFKGTDKVKKKYVPRKKRKKNQVFINAIQKAQKRMAIDEKRRNAAGSGGAQAQADAGADVAGGSAGAAVQPANPLFEFDMNSLLFPGNEWISNELRDDALLSASAMQGATMASFGHSAGRTERVKTDHVAASTASAAAAAPEWPQLGIEVEPSPSTTVSSTSTHHIVDENELAKVYRLLFHRTGTEDDAGSAAGASEPGTVHARDFLGVVPLKDFVELNAPGSRMPVSVVDVVESKLPDTSIFNQPGNSNILLDLPTTGVHVHGLARFLLNYYLQNVADLMTVVVLPTNPWKTIYFPRALKALGDLTGIGYTSNSRNSLLNALLAVSCFNLQSKFPKNSPEMKYFLSLGIEFRTQASSFLKRCLSSTVNQERYKDILTAILSMNSIDVVWGTMADCQVHLTICEDFIEKRMKTRPQISAKAKALHRIFSFLKLIQDSTSLDKVREKEIVILETTPAQSMHNVYSPVGEFKESLNEKDGKISIKFVTASSSASKASESPSVVAESPQATTPMFSNIASESYYYPKSNQTNSDVLSTDSLYGLPNSLILLFSDCVRLARHLEYYNQNQIKPPAAFSRLCQQFENRVLNWKSEWDFMLPGTTDMFINETIEGVYHHTMSFHNGLIIYYYTVVKNYDYSVVQTHVKKVLGSLNKLTNLIDNHGVKIVPLIWQGFMAGCACTDAMLQLGFKEWAAKLVKTGMGSYWGARQIMFEVWRRRLNNEENDNWFSVYKDWEMNLMLS